MAGAKKKKLKTKEVKKKKVRNGKRKAALILSIIAIAILAINTVYYFVAKGTLLNEIKEGLQKLPGDALGGKDISALVQITLNVMLALAIIWLMLAVLMAWTTWLLERRKGKWYMPVIIGIVALLTLRIETGVLCIIAGVLYK